MSGISAAEAADRTAISLRLQLEQGLKSFEVIRELGAGAFGRAILVRNRCDDNLYVLKVLDLGRLSEKERKASIGEVEVLSSLIHPNIIAYYGSFFEHGSSVLHIVLGVCTYTHAYAHADETIDHKFEYLHERMRMRAHVHL